MPRQPDPAKGSLGVLRRRRPATSSARCPTRSGTTSRPEYAARVRDLLASGRFDLVVCDFLPPVANLPDRLPCPAVLFTHNVESEIWRRHVDMALAGPRRWLMAVATSPHAAIRAEAVRRFDLVLAVSDADAKHARPPLRSAAATRTRRADRCRHGVLRAARGDRAHQAPRLHRLDGLAPQRGRRHAFRARRAAAHPPRRAEHHAGHRRPRPDAGRASACGSSTASTVTGRVDDVRPFIAEAAVYIVPLRIGGGTRLKIFEAMAMGKSIVSTTIGAEGLPVDDGLAPPARRRPVRRSRTRPCASCRTRRSARDSAMPHATSSRNASTGRR